MARSEIDATVDVIETARDWNDRVSLVRRIPEWYGTARHAEIYAAVAQAIYVPNLAPDFAYVPMRPDYELSTVETAYAEAYETTRGFRSVSVDATSSRRTRRPRSARRWRPAPRAVAPAGPGARSAHRPAGSDRVQAVATAGADWPLPRPRERRLRGLGECPSDASARAAAAGWAPPCAST
jgi:hypothetical protein